MHKNIDIFETKSCYLENAISWLQDNTRSRRVMEEIGLLHHEQDDFDHPKLPKGHPLRRHILYRLRHE